MDILIRGVSEKTTDKLSELADKEKRSRSKQIIWMLEKALEKKEK